MTEPVHPSVALSWAPDCSMPAGSISLTAGPR